MALTVHLIVIAQILLAFGEPIENGRDVGRITENPNGEKKVLNPGKFPYIVFLDIKKYRMEKDTEKFVHVSCGGTLISPDVVLTAAHCVGVYKEKKPKMTAWMGILDIVLDKGKGQKIAVRGYTIHKSYLPPKPGMALRTVNDIALLWLQHPAKLDGKFVKPANLPTENFIAEGKRGWVIGWGRQNCGKEPTMLQKAVMRGVSAAECQKYYQLKIMPSVICTMSDDKKSISSVGDSGGPFIVQNTVVGVSSFVPMDLENKNEKTGLFGCDAKRPAAYTFVVKYVYWIRGCINEGPETVI